MLRKKTSKFTLDHLKICIFGLQRTFAVCFQPPVVTHTAAQPPQALSRSNSLNSKLLLRDTCLLFSAILTAGDSHFHLKNKTGAKQPVELELEHTLSSPRTTFASGDDFFTNRASLSLVLQTGWVSTTGGGLLPRERHLQPALLPLLWEKGSGGCFCI